MKIIISERQYRMLLESENSTSLLIIGDSHSVDAKFTYSSLLKKDFDKVVIGAVGGKRTSWMKTELSKQLSNQKFDKVTIWGGANDMFSNVTISEAISNIQQMVDMVNAQGGTPYVIVGFDQNIFSVKGKFKGTKYATPKQMDEMREKYIEFQKQLPSSISNAVIIPAFNIDNSHTSDNAHGNSAAHNKVYQIVKSALGSESSVKKNTESEKDTDLVSNLKKIIESGKTFESQKKGERTYDKNVEDLQTALQFLGYSLPEWGVDGKFGPETKRAVEKFQSGNNLDEDGKVTSKVLEKIIQSLEDKDYKPEDLSKIKKEKTTSINSETPVISNPGVKVRSYPSNLVEQFKAIAGDYYDTFIDDVKSIGLDPIIAIRQLYTESGFQPDVINCNRRSSAGAMGIAQFMPGTWPSYGEGSPCEVKNALKAYVKFMKVLLNRFPGRPEIAVAAYNSGPNLKIYKNALDNNIEFTDLNGKIPKESYAYSSMIFQA